MKRITICKDSSRVGGNWYPSSIADIVGEISLCSDWMSRLFPQLKGQSRATLLLSRRRFVGSRTIRIPRSGGACNENAVADADLRPWTDIVYRQRRIYVRHFTWRALIPIIQAEGCTDVVYVGIEVNL